MAIKLLEKIVKGFSGGTGLLDANNVEIDASGFSTNLDNTIIDTQLLAAAVDGLSLAPAPVPSLHNFSIDIPSRVDLNTDLNVQHTLTFDVSNYSHLTVLTLLVTNGDNKTLVLPIRDGSQNQVVTLSGIDTATDTTITFQLSGSHPGGLATSNIVTVNVQDLQTHEFAYYGARPTNDFDTVDTSLLSSADVSNSGSVYVINVQVANGQFLGILSPVNRDPTSIIETTTNTESLADFTVAPGNPVRVINSVSYNLLTNQNNSGFTGTYNFRITTE